MGMLTKLRYAGACTEDLIYIYKQFIRSKLEYCSVVFHSSLTLQQSYSLERCQAVCLRIILMDMYVTYSSALEMTGLSKLSDRRLNRCLDFSLKCLKDPYNSRFFPKNPNLNLTIESRKREQFKINFSRTNSYKNSTIPFCQRLLNNHWARLEQEEEEGEGEEEEGEAGWGLVMQGGGTKMWIMISVFSNVHGRSHLLIKPLIKIVCVSKFQHVKKVLSHWLQM